MKHKLAAESMTLVGQTVGPRPDLEQAERLKAILRTRADDQFELDLLFSGNPKIRHQTRQKIEKLLIQSEAAETMAPGLQRDMSKMAFVTDEEAKILGLGKTAGRFSGLGRDLRAFKPKPLPKPPVATIPLAAVAKTASIAPNVDAWFAKNASVLKKAAIPTPAIGLKATRVTASPRPGRVPAMSNLAGGSA